MGKYNYAVVQNRATGMDAIKLLDDPFQGIIVSYGSVEVIVDEEQSKLHINFEYEILDKNNKDFSNIEPFEEYLGNLLEQILHEGIEEATNH